jgi:hypothetical protein
VSNKTKLLSSTSVPVIIEDEDGNKVDITGYLVPSNGGAQRTWHLTCAEGRVTVVEVKSFDDLEPAPIAPDGRLVVPNPDTFNQVIKELREEFGVDGEFEAVWDTASGDFKYRLLDRQPNRLH